MIKKFASKLLFIIVITIFLQLFATRMFPTQLKEQSEKDRQYLTNFKATKADVLIFGDSVYFSINPNEKDKTSLESLLKLKNNDKSFLSVIRPAMHAGLFPVYIKSKVQSANQPKYVIIPINLRTFSYMWDLRPEFLFEDEEIKMQFVDNEVYRAFARPLKVFKFNGFFDVRQDQYEDLPVIINGQNIGRVKSLYTQENKQNLKNIWGFLYMYNLTSTHRKLQSMVEAIKVLKQNNIKAIVYITPIDYQSAADYWGETFKNTVTKNTGVIKAELKKYQVDVLDLALALPKEDFDWRRDDYPDEHLMFSGREFLADEITKMLK